MVFVISEQWNWFSRGMSVLYCSRILYIQIYEYDETWDVHVWIFCLVRIETCFHHETSRKDPNRKTKAFFVGTHSFCKETTQEGLSLKKSNLKLLMPKAYLELAAGSFVEVHSLQSRPEWNGRIASVVQLLSERWAQFKSKDKMNQWAWNLTILGLSLSIIPLPSLEVQQSIDLESLAGMVLQDFVEGPRSYPVIRKLSKFKMDNGTEELYPANGSETRLLPTTWCDLELSQSERLFYKMSLSGRCAELTYTFVDLINGMAEKQLPTLSWQRPCRYVLVCGFCDPSISTYAPHERFWGSLLATQPASTQRCSKSPVVGISSFWSLPAWSKKANDPGFIWGSIWHAYTRENDLFWWKAKTNDIKSAMRSLAQLPRYIFYCGPPS